MRFKSRNMIYLYIFFLSFFANAFTEKQLGKKLNFAIGIDLTQSQYKAGRFKFDDYSAYKNPINNAFSKVAWNISYRPFTLPLWTGFRTNYGINTSVDSTAYDRKLKINVNVNSSSVSNTFYIATALNKNVFPFIALTNVNTKTYIESKFYKIKSEKNANIYGIGFGTPLNNKLFLSGTYYFGNNILNTKRIFTVSLNFLL